MERRWERRRGRRRVVARDGPLRPATWIRASRRRKPPEECLEPQSRTPTSPDSGQPPAPRKEHDSEACKDPVSRPMVANRGARWEGGWVRARARVRGGRSAHAENTGTFPQRHPEVHGSQESVAQRSWGAGAPTNPLHTPFNDRAAGRGRRDPAGRPPAVGNRKPAVGSMREPPAARRHLAGSNPYKGEQRHTTCGPRQGGTREECGRRPQPRAPAARATGRGAAAS